MKGKFTPVNSLKLDLKKIETLKKREKEQDFIMIYLKIYIP